MCVCVCVGWGAYLWDVTYSLMAPLSPLVSLASHPVPALYCPSEHTRPSSEILVHTRGK